MTAPVKLIVDFYLTTDERNSGTWQSLKAHFERMLAKKRIDNDNPKLTDVETATLRGHIDCLKAMIALGKTPPQMAATAARPARALTGARHG